MKRLIRWFFYLVALVVLLVVAGILLLDTIARELAESQIRAVTGMDVKIGKFSIGLATPTIRIEDFRLYNSAEFGGSPFIDMPELFLEYDRDAIVSGKLHLKLVRLNLSEINIVKNKKGRLNVDALEQRENQNKGGMKIKMRGIQFTGIDTLNLTLGKCHTQDQDITFGITNQVFHNVRTEADLQGVGVLLALKSGALPFLQQDPARTNVVK